MVKRRNLLQFAGSTLAALGLSQLALERQSLRYAKALAQDTPRKLALLVGVNRYQKSRRFTNLRGCATDAEMQRQLLVHRFKFHPDDICVVSDEAGLPPTRETILTAFEDHLIKQATPDSVVVFHFSGHGSRVLDPDPLYEDDLNSTFVPGDVAGDTEQVDDIMGRTLFLLMSALETERVVAVLDSCYSGGGTRGNVRIRAADGGRAFKPSDRELNYQEKWLNILEEKNRLDRAEFLQRRELGAAKGFVIAAAQRNQAAADVAFDGFDAGAFTYLMTQFLWQQTDSLKSVVARIRADTRALSGQLPLVEASPDQTSPDESMYFVPDEEQTPPAEAVVIATAAAGEAIVWLGGVHPEVIATFNRGARLNTANASEPPLVIKARQGLLAKVSVHAPLPANTLLREETRVLPQDLTLVIGIDPSLAAKAQQIQARINDWPHMSAIPAGADSLYGAEVHYILGRMTAAYRQRLPQRAGLPEENAIGLFTQSLSDWIPGSFRPAAEPAHSAVLNLLPKLRSHLAARFIRATLNAPSSQLAIQATIDNLETGQRIAAAATGRGKQSTAAPIGDSSNPVTVADRLQISVTNLESQPLYIGVVGVKPSGELIILLPLNVSASISIAPEQTQLIPDPALQSDLILGEPGIYETMVLTSKTPFTRALKGLDAIANGERVPNTPDPNENLSGLNGLFEGFDTPRGEEAAFGAQVLGVDAIATLSMTIEAVG